MTIEFFNELQKHSDAKLRILNNYVIPWMRKIILGTRKFGGGKCLVIDGFAGQGAYHNGEITTDGSPIILLKNAIDFCVQSKANKWDPPEINLIFIEGVSENFDKLKARIKEILNIEVNSSLSGKFFFENQTYPSIKIACVNAEFKYVLQTILKSVPNLIPSFCFIDPFGFKDTPFELIKTYLKNQKAEILLNFIYEETNRFIGFQNEKNQEHMKNQFGVADMSGILNLLKDADPTLRKQIIVSYYASQLHNDANAKHVLSFEIKKNGRTKLVLFYATKSDEGLKVMKQAMWGVDNTGSYLFDDQVSSDQIEFDFVSEEREIVHIANLAKKIELFFVGKDNITKEDIETFVAISTIYPTGKLVTAALISLESTHKIKKVTKMDGTNRRPNTYKDVYIDFY